MNAVGSAVAPLDTVGGSLHFGVSVTIPFSTVPSSLSPDETE